MIVNFIDAVMGAGKSSYAIDLVRNRSSEERYIVAAPTLAEVERYAIGANLSRCVSQYNKTSELIDILKDGKSVAVSHALLVRALRNSFVRFHLECYGYKLILDEVIADPIYTIQIERDTLTTLSNAKVIDIDSSSGKITWTADKDYEDRIALRDACLEDDVYCVDGAFAVGVLSLETFDLFTDIKVLTYMSSYSMLYKYFFYNNATIYTYNLSNGRVTLGAAKYSGKQFASLIEIDATKRRNNIDIRLTSTGMRGLKRARVELLSGYVSGFYRQHRSDFHKPQRLWTTYKREAERVQGRGVDVLHDMSNFLQHSSRGTNDYSHTGIAAYALDKHLNPGIVKFLKENNIQYHRKTALCASGGDLWALSEMLQWIWRTRVRNGEPIKLYIPAERMRQLMVDWLQ